ncbi:hypothetical protein J6590_037940 [Homalodisca vitripennis]|nr:hypothetical protein J6590_037940 [Homalodisca vitripennis]
MGERGEARPPARLHQITLMSVPCRQYSVIWLATHILHSTFYARQRRGDVSFTYITDTHRQFLNNSRTSMKEQEDFDTWAPLRHGGSSNPQLLIAVGRGRRRAEGVEGAATRDSSHTPRGWNIQQQLMRQ